MTGNFGWPYNLYSAITGLSVPDTEYMKGRLYRYKYQRGYYCFSMMPPEKAHTFMSEYLTQYARSMNSVIGIYVYDDKLYKMLMNIVLLHKYAYNRSYDEILYMFYNDFEAFVSCIRYPKHLIPVLEMDIKRAYGYWNKRKLYRSEIETLSSLRKWSFSGYFLSYNSWEIVGLKQPKITERVRLSEKIKLYSSSNNNLVYNSKFHINCKLFLDSGLGFDTGIDQTIDDKRIIEFLSIHGIDTIDRLCYTFHSGLAKSLYQHDVVVIFECLKKAGIIVDNKFYSQCIKNSKIERVCKKKVNKRIIHEVKFVETKTPEKVRRKTIAEIEIDKILESKGDKITRKKRQLERDRYYRNLLMERGHTNILDSDRVDCRKNNTPEYIPSFNKSATLGDVREYFSAPPEYVRQEYLSSIGIYCDLIQYDQ